MGCGGSTGKQVLVGGEAKMPHWDLYGVWAQIVHSVWHTSDWSGDPAGAGVFVAADGGLGQ